MIVTMYKGCILTANYQEVFDTKIREGKTTSVFEDYLASLDKKSFNVNGYVTDSGSFNIAYDLDGMNAFECNYVRFMSDFEGEITVYAFVDSVVRSNNCITVNYTVDVFHTYFPVCSLRDSLISNFRKKVNGEHAELPLAYQTNSPLNLLMVSEGYDEFYYTIAQVIIYKLVNDKPTDLETGLYMIKAPSYTDFNETSTLIKTLESYQGKPFTNNEIQYYYKLTKYYIFPKDIAITDILVTSSPSYSIEISSSLIIGLHLLRTVELNKIELNSKGNEYITKNDDGSLSILNKYNIIGFGTLSNCIRILNNGLITKIECYYSANSFDIELFISLNGVLYSITSLFEILLPFEGLDGSTYAQRQIAKEVGTLKGVQNIFQGVGNIVSSAMQTSAAGAQASAGNYAGSMNTSSAAVSSFVSGTNKIVSGIMEIDVANRDKYLSFYGNNCDNVQSVNSYYGFAIYYITPNNESEVENAINEMGYNVFYKTDDLEYGQSIEVWDYNVVRFINAKVVGNCPQNILGQIKQILENGVKVWYTTNVS